MIDPAIRILYKLLEAGYTVTLVPGPSPPHFYVWTHADNGRSTLLQSPPRWSIIATLEELEKAYDARTNEVTT